MIIVPELETRNLRLVPFGPDDEGYLFLLYDRAARSRFAEFPVLEPEAFQAYMVEHMSGPTAGWVIRHRETDVELGTVYLEQVTFGVTGTLHVNLDVDAVKDVRPTNPDGSLVRVVDEAARAVIRHAFEVLGVERVTSAATPQNVYAIKLAERMGFRKEGVLRRGAKVKGEARDVVLYGLLKEEMV